MVEKPSRSIRLTGVRQNNLKNISVEFPARKISVITGLSGSGKSSLAFDTLYAEGQRRYIESLSTYTRQFLEKMPKPDLDSIENIPPAIALEQKNHVVNSRSTVGTQTEIVDYLRILFAKVGQTFCMKCNGKVQALNSQDILQWATHWLPNRKALIVAPIGGNLTPPPTSSSSKAKSSNAKKKGTQQTKKKSASNSDVGSGSGLNITPESLSLVLRGQGFQRILTQSEQDVFEVVDLEELTPANLKNKKEVYVVVDRLKLTEDFDADVRGRVRGSIDQALAAGRGRIGFYDMEEKSNSHWKLFDHRFACLDCGTEHRRPEPNLFSFNSPIGACSECSGFGFTLNLDEALIVPDPTKTLKNGAIDPFSKPSFSEAQTLLFRFAERHSISISKRYADLTGSQRKLLWEGDPNDPTFQGITATFEELKKWKYKLYIRVFIRRYQSQSLCSACHGSRLKPEATCVKITDKSISDILADSISDVLQWIHSIDLKPSDRKIAEEVFAQIERRLSFLDEVGVGYLSLSRLTKTLSGGEYQRINLATQLGNGLCGTLYVLDEPSIGLHASDTDRLIRILIRLRDQGNSVVIVEHDLDIMKAADWLVELGPGAGRKGGERVAQGTAADLIKIPSSLTGKYLALKNKIPDLTVRQNKTSHLNRDGGTDFLRLKGCRENNLQNIDVSFPLRSLVVVTGVSGSGKSTLVHKTLYSALSRLFYRTTDTAGKFDRLYGAEHLGGVVLLDQTSIGKSSRSNPATYLKAWDEVRRIYANQVLSLRRGYTPQYFSFNVEGGRCSVCKGEGEVTLDMHFMAEIKLPCEECGGKRFKKNVLEILYRGKNIYQLLQTTIDESYELFRDNPILAKKLGILRDVGLGYLQLGQSSTTLSGGESQRLKIAATLDDKAGDKLLYIFDEPTTGLHSEDVKRLTQVLRDLVSAKHSVIMIEHHLDVIANADWVIDLGPQGGTRGGHLVAEGPPQQLMSNPASITGHSLTHYYSGQ